jgi:hypothetical protein
VPTVDPTSVLLFLSYTCSTDALSMSCLSVGSYQPAAFVAAPPGVLASPTCGVLASHTLTPLGLASLDAAASWVL